MDLKDIAEWLHEMEDVTGGCVLDIRADGRAGLRLELSWRHDGRAMGYEHHMSDIELRLMRADVQHLVLQQIRNRVERMCCPRPKTVRVVEPIGGWPTGD